jgi:hypothetical protein
LIDLGTREENFSLRAAVQALMRSGCTWGVRNDDLKRLEARTLERRRMREQKDCTEKDCTHV